jgi:hypothetical protein
MHVFHALDPVRAKNITEPVEKFRLVKILNINTNLITSKLEIISEEGADKAASDFPASAASVDKQIHAFEQTNKNFC